jgi:nucleotide-binding universal stress UspA family protein
MSQYSCRNILVPVDLSEASLNALDTAASIAKVQGARLLIIYVEEEGLDYLKEETAHSYPDHSVDVVAALANAIQHKTDFKPEVLRESGAVVNCVLRKCVEYHCDLIVMGTHGASGYRDGFIGSNTYSIAKYSPCPVLTIPAQKKWTAFRKVLFPVRPVTGALARYDVVKNFLSQQSQLNILGLSYRRQDRDVTVLEELTMEISSRVKDDKIITKTAWGAGGGISEDVLNYSLQNNSDLIVVTSSLDVANKPHFIGPNVQKIIHGAKVPVLHIKRVAVHTSAAV